MFKVCIMSDTWFPIIGGGPKVAWEVAKRLTADFSCQVDIITRRFPNQKIQTLPKNLKIIYLGPRLPWNNNFSRLIFILLSFKYLLGKKYDIVHAFPFVAGFPVLAASHFNKTPTIFSVFALNTNNLLEKFLVLKLRYSAQITDNTEFLKISNKNKVYYVPDGVDISQFNKVKVAKYKVPTILFVGRFHPQKSISLLLQVANDLCKKIKNLKFVLVGYGREEKNIRDFVSSNNLKGRILPKGKLIGKKLIEEYKKASIFVLPSLYEGQGIVVLEAWAAKLPVIATRVGSLKQIVKDKENGILVNPGDYKGLEKAIIGLLFAKDIDKYGQRGYEIVKKNYSWDETAKKIFKIYQTLT